MSDRSKYRPATAAWALLTTPVSPGEVTCCALKDFIYCGGGDPGLRWLATCRGLELLWPGQNENARQSWGCVPSIWVFSKFFCVHSSGDNQRQFVFSPIILCSVGSVPLSLNEELVKPVISVPS